MTSEGTCGPRSGGPPSSRWPILGSPMGEFMLTVLGGVATLERHLIKARTDTGIKRARAAGIKFGRPSALNKHQQEEALKLLADGKLQSGDSILLLRTMNPRWH
jgi:DNA invertase Pin-like site-specific DNA recombinase